MLDEIAMLLHLDDVYWTTEGRLSIDARQGAGGCGGVRRFAARDARWTRRRNRFYDLIGGAPHLGSKRDSAPTPK